MSRSTDFTTHAAAAGPHEASVTFRCKYKSSTVNGRLSFAMLIPTCCGAPSGRAMKQAWSAPGSKAFERGSSLWSVAPNRGGRSDRLLRSGGFQRGTAPMTEARACLRLNVYSGRMDAHTSFLS